MRFWTRAEDNQTRTFVLTRSLGATFVVAALIALPLLNGCGGGHDDGGGKPAPSPSPSATPTPVAARKSASVSVIWGALGRGAIDVHAIGSARSVRLRIFDGDPRTTQPVAVLTGNRDPANPASYTATFTTGSATVDVTKVITVDADFFAGQNQTGSLVATGTLFSPVDPNTGVLTNSVTLVGRVTSVSLLPLTAFVGETETVPVSILNQFGDALVVSPDSVTISVTGGSANLSTGALQTVRGVTPGMATLTATVDGITSAPATVSVVSRGTLAITPANPTVSSEQSLAFTVAGGGFPAGVNGNAVVWSVDGTNNGSITQGGVYTAPKITGSNTQAVTVRATSVYDPTKSATTIVTLASLVTVQVTPLAPNVSWEDQIPFTAKVLLTSNQTVIWALEGTGTGTITPAGLYTAPKKDGTYYVVATSVYDGSKSARVPVIVASQTAVSVAPASPVSLSVNAKQQFTATVTRAADTSVTWSVDPDPAGAAAGLPVGTIDPVSGLYTAPPHRRTDTVRATSNYDPRKSTPVTVQVTAGSAIVTVQ